jgi:hypothetical protein
MPALVVLLKTREPSLLLPLCHGEVPISSKDTDEHMVSSDREGVCGNEKLNEKLLTAEGISGKGEGIEFGTVMVFCCGQSCWNDKDQSCLMLREEFAVVQADPDAELFQNTV